MDSFSIAAMGIAVYYFPVFSGQLFYLDSAANAYKLGKPPDIKLQLIIVFSFYFLYASSYVFSAFCSNRSGFKWVVYDKTVVFVIVLCSLAFCFFVLPMITYASSKVEVGESLGSLVGVGIYVLSLGALAAGYAAFINKELVNGMSRKLMFLSFSFILLVAVFVLRTRSLVFFSVLALMVYGFHGMKFKYKNIKPKYVISLFLLVFLLLGKHISNMVILGVEYDGFFLVLKDSLESYGVSSNLNYVIESGFRKLYLNKIYLDLFPFMASLDAEYLDYHDVLKMHFFPGVDYGMGRNPIGELWVNFGWSGVVFYPIVLSLKCVFFDRVINKSDGFLKMFLILVMIISVFYFNRNSFQNDISFHRNYLLFFCFFLLASSVSFNGFLFKKIRVGAHSPSAK